MRATHSKIRREISLPTALAGKVKQSVASVCPSVYLFSLLSFEPTKLLNLNLCVCLWPYVACIENRGHRSRSRTVFSSSFNLSIYLSTTTNKRATYKTRNSILLTGYNRRVYSSRRRRNNTHASTKLTTTSGHKFRPYIDNKTK